MLRCTPWKEPVIPGSVRLHLALFIGAQHQGLFWQIPVQTHNVAYLLNEQRVSRYLQDSLRCGWMPTA
jgi:hypothetical protein